ncbi:hypothetical protein HYW35_01750 [Candidatus Saccharibacteria bacterium]|nr:hypothetical protein [Candidatus Saccharibacteria bacterium]
MKEYDLAVLGTEAINKCGSKLIFVYNAKGGFMHSMLDLARKTVSPKTYPCKLCMMTYSGATMNKLWKQYVVNLGMPSIFMHRDEFSRAYSDQNITFPAIILEQNGSITMLISSDEFKSTTGLSDLMDLLSKKLRDVQPAGKY